MEFNRPKIHPSEILTIVITVNFLRKLGKKKLGLIKKTGLMEKKGLQTRSFAGNYFIKTFWIVYEGLSKSS